MCVVRKTRACLHSRLGLDLQKYFCSGCALVVQQLFLTWSFPVKLNTNHAVMALPPVQITCLNFNLNEDRGLYNLSNGEKEPTKSSVQLIPKNEVLKNQTLKMSNIGARYQIYKCSAIIH